MSRPRTWPPGSTMTHWLREQPWWAAAQTACGKRANLANWSTHFGSVTCRDCLAIADQSPEGETRSGSMRSTRAAVREAQSPKLPQGGHSD